MINQWRQFPVTSIASPSSILHLTDFGPAFAYQYSSHPGLHADSDKAIIDLWRTLANSYSRLLILLTVISVVMGRFVWQKLNCNRINIVVADNYDSSCDNRSYNSITPLWFVPAIEMMEMMEMMKIIGNRTENKQKVCLENPFCWEWCVNCLEFFTFFKLIWSM